MATRSCLEKPMDRGVWWATVHGVAKNWTRLQCLSTHARMHCTLQMTESNVYISAFPLYALSATSALTFLKPSLLLEPGLSPCGLLRLQSCFLVSFADSSFFLCCAVLCCAKSLQSCPTLCDPKDCSPAGSSVHGIFRERILEWVAMFFCNRSS